MLIGSERIAEVVDSLNSYYAGRSVSAQLLAEIEAETRAALLLGPDMPVEVRGEDGYGWQKVTIVVG